jgi:peptide/nickel transport system permease protein
MMLDQNENSEQLALIKKKYGFDKPIATSIYTISMTYHRFHCTEKRVRLHVFSEGKYNAAPLFSFSIVIKTPYLRESFRKVERKYRK